MTNPVVIRGVYYKSQADAARALGVSTSLVYKALAEGTLDQLERWSSPCEINGVEYSGIFEAAKILNISAIKVRDLLIRELEEKNERLLEIIERAASTLVELDLGNYDQSDVRDANAATVEVKHILDAALAGQGKQE